MTRAKHVFQGMMRVGGITALVAMLPVAISAVESPTSYGAAATVDAATVRIPATEKPPTIDGVMEKGEWEDATAISGFWYCRGINDFSHIAGGLTQDKVYWMYDKDNLYIAVVYPVYPEGSWLRALGRFPDVLMHPQYGVLNDDHVEIELRPYHDPARGFKLGLLRWDVNPINTVCDWTWSLKRGSYEMSWKSGATIRSKVDARNWIVEYSIPLQCMLWEDYKGKDEEGAPLVVIPPPDNTKYRFWVHCGIGGTGMPLTHIFDQNIWNTTKGQLIFDSKSCSFQLNDMGPFMEDMIDMKLTVKNHNSRSETMRIGFFMENEQGLIYSSYEAPELKEGMLELRPDEVRELRLKKTMPGVSKEGNVLWFDVRSAGTPAKVLFRARLMKFHSMEGGGTPGSAPVLDPVTKQPVLDPNTGKPTMVPIVQSYRELYLDGIANSRAARQDFDVRFQFSPYDKRIYAVVDRGGPAATDEAKRAVEAKMMVMKNDSEETLLKEAKIPFKGDFGFFLFDVPEMADGEIYKASVLLFDENQRIVGEKNVPSFKIWTGPWKNNKVGLDDVVWEGFDPIRVASNGFDTTKHRFDLAPSGLPAQMFIKPDVRDLPLEKRTAGATMSDAELLELGRGPQLRGPMQLEAVVKGTRIPAEATAPVKLTREGKSEVEYASALKIGPLDATLKTRYDCDGSMHCQLEYGADKPQAIDRFELVMPVDGLVDIAFSETGKGTMAGADTWECGVPNTEGIIWESSRVSRELTYGRFIPWFWFGSADRGFTWFCDSSEGWIMDKEGSTMQLERDKAGKVTWRVQFVNRPAEVKGKRRIAFSLLAHPAKSKPKDYRSAAWNYTLGPAWCDGYNSEPYDLPEARLKAGWRTASQAPKEISDNQATTWRKDEPPFHRYGKWRHLQAGFASECPRLDRLWEDKATYLFERQIRVGRRVGWHMDEYFPVAMGHSDNMAMGEGYIRELSSEDTNGVAVLPWNDGFLTGYMRNHYKRLARVSQANNVPQRHQSWSNNEATMLESFWWSSFLVEECGAGHRSFDVDIVTQFPSTLYRYLAHNYSGLVTALMADATDAGSGDDKRLDRQHIGRCLLNDIGVTPSGAHGIIHHKQDMMRLFRVLQDFGFFDDANIEKIPFWRNEPYVKIGDKPSSESEVYVTAYRRPLKDSKGYQALFIVMNESFKPVELPLKLVNTARLLGGGNTLKPTDVRGRTKVQENLRAWWDAAKAKEAQAAVLQDVESGDVVQPVPGSAETYGPVYVPYHDFRVFFAQHEEGK